MLDKAKNRGTPRPYLRNVNVRWFDFDLSDIKSMPFEDNELSEFAICPGDVLICEGGEPGRAAVWTGHDSEIYFQKALHRIRLHSSVLPRFFTYYLRFASDEGLLTPYSTGATFQHLTGQALAKIPIPVPPLAEQHDIIAKVDELLALCNELETAQTEREARRNRLRVTSLRSFVAPDAPKESAQFFLRNSTRMITLPEHVADVRQAILDLAVQGRLVQQDPRDEPAIDWLRRSAGQAPGKITSVSSMDGLTSSGWATVTLKDLAPTVTSGSRGWAQFYADRGALFIRSQNIKYGYLLMNDRAHVAPPAGSEGTRTSVDVGDLLVVITGDVGYAAIWDQDLGEAYVSQHVALVKPFTPEVSRWLLLCLMAPTAGRRQLRSSIYGGKPGLNLNQVRSVVLPLPPVAEQQRIIAKVDELLAVCDGLEQSLALEQTERCRLLQALLHDAAP
jgi:type I restriction enzyme S subunit